MLWASTVQFLLVIHDYLVEDLIRVILMMPPLGFLREQVCDPLIVIISPQQFECMDRNRTPPAGLWEVQDEMGGPRLRYDLHPLLRLVA